MSSNKEKNDWDDEDESWDDWGDAEDQSDPVDTKQPALKTQIVDNKLEQNNSIENTNSSCSSSGRQADQAKDNNSSSFWKPWGGVMSSVLSTANNITSTVSQGLNQVIGVPDPEELARINAAEEETRKAQQPQSSASSPIESESKSTQMESDSAGFGLGMVTSLGSKVLNTGLDTLEGIGKKTMNILQENDPLLKNKRKMLGFEAEKPNLSEILKEAKKDADQLENTLKELKLEKSKEMLRFEILFENHCGLVHLEALEILSKESSIKLQALLDSVSGNALTNLQETIDEVKELFEMEELEGDSEGNYSNSDLNEKLQAAVSDADLKIQFDDLTNLWSTAVQWISEDSAAAAEQERFAKSINCLAESCAFEMNKLHKIAELLLVKEHHSTANEIDAIVQLCKQFGEHLHGLTNRFAAVLGDSAEAKSNITTLFAEMMLAVQHLEKAFHLFLPILQIGAV